MKLTLKELELAIPTIDLLESRKIVGGYNEDQNIAFEVNGDDVVVIASPEPDRGYDPRENDPLEQEEHEMYQGEDGRDNDRPVLDELPNLLPGYGFKPTTDSYAMYGEYYRIKAGITLLGGITIKEDFNLVFTPLFHGQPCGKQHDINSMDDLLAALKEQLERREVACKI